MSKEIKLANKAIFHFIRDHVIADKAAFFDESNRDNQEKLKQLLLNRFAYCRQPTMPDQQRRNIVQFFYEVSQYVLMESTKPSSLPHATSSIVGADCETTLKSFWSFIGLLLLDDLNRNPNIHQGGYLRGRSAGGNHDSLLFLAILHQQLFGMNLVKAAKSYPLKWGEWTSFIGQRFILLTQDLQNPILTHQRQLWTQVFSSILDTIAIDDLKRHEKFVYQVFFNIVSPFKSVTMVGSEYKTFEVPITLIKANPTSLKGSMDVALMSELQQLLQAPLNELRQALVLPPATATMITELKSKLKVTTASSIEPKQAQQEDEDECSWKTCLKVTRAVETYGSINSLPEKGQPLISHCHSSLYTHVPKAIQMESRAANDNCCACAIL